MVKDCPPEVVASKEVLMRMSLSLEVNAIELARVTAPVQLCTPLVFILAAIVVGPVTVKPAIRDVPPSAPLNVTLPELALPVVAVKV